MDGRIFEIDKVKKEDKDQALKTMFCNTDMSASSVWVVKAGQKVQCHKHEDADDVWIITKGEGLFHPEVGKDVPVKAGTVILNKKGDCHGLTNNSNSDLEFVSVLAPYPAQCVALA